MWISARNRLEGTITDIAEGGANGIVSIDLGFATVKADIPMESVNELMLEEGKRVFAVIKATDVMIAAASEPLVGLSARNQLPGIVTNINKGLANGHVSLQLPNGATMMASITREAIDELGLDEENDAIAIFSETDAMVGTED